MLRCAWAYACLFLATLGVMMCAHGEYTTIEEPMLTNLEARLDWSYAAAWKSQNGMRETVSLCGLWNFAAAKNASAAIPAASSQDWAYFVVPGHWRGGNITNYVHTQDGKAVTEFNSTPLKEVYHGWYKRTLDIPAEWNDKQVVWNFERLDISGDLFLNGKKIADTSVFTKTGSGKVAISEFLKYGEKNEFAVRCDTDEENTGGLRGVVSLLIAPKVNFGEPHVENMNFEKQAMTLVFRHPTAEKGTLSMVIRDWKTDEIVFSNEYPFSSEIPVDFMPPKLWSPESPNLYYMDLTLAHDGETLDAQTIRFGFADFRVQGADYYLNGKKIILSADTALDDGGYWSVDWKMGREYIRRQLKLMRSMNINATYFGAWMPKYLLDIYDEEGIIILAHSLLTYYEHHEIDDEEAYKRFQRKISDIKESDRYDNHPSHLCYLIDVWTNYHSGAVNQEFVGLKTGTPTHPAFDKDGSIIERQGDDPNLTADRRQIKARLDHIAAMYNEAFPGKVIFTGADGDIGNVYATHLYHTWGAPIEELRAFFYRYSLQRELPMFIGEFNIPYPGSLYHIFNFNAGGAPLAMENFARYAGNDGYRWRTIYGMRVLHDIGPESQQGSRYDRDKEGEYYYGNDMYSLMLNKSLETIVPGWRHSGVNGIGFFGYVLGNHFAIAGAVGDRWRELPMDLSEPEYHPEMLLGGAALDAFLTYDTPLCIKPTLNGVPFQRVSAPVLAEFLSTSNDPYEMDHAWFGGEEISKQLMILNDSESDQELDYKVELCNEDGTVFQTLKGNVSIEQGGRQSIPVKVTAPWVASRTNGILRANVKNGSKSVSFAQMKVQFFPPCPALKLRHPLYVCDPEGGVKQYLDKIGVDYKEIVQLDSVPDNVLLLVGRRGLSLNPTVPDFCQLADKGVNILIMEQENSASLELLEKRSRHAFINAPAHPVFDGLTDEDFSDWRGGVSLASSFGGSNLAGQWSHAGNRNMVASYVFRRPVHGNYLPLLCCGFDMFQTPLLEYRSRVGSWLGSQLEIVPRLGIDPVATRIFHQMLGYLDNRCPVSGKTLFFGGDKGREILSRMKINAEEITSLDAETLEEGAVLLISDPDFEALKKANFALVHYIYKGGKILYLQSGDTFSSVWLPFPLKLEKAKTRQALHAVDKPDSFWRNGWGNNDLYWHDETEVPVFTEIPEQANAMNPGVCVDLPYGTGRFTFVSILPESFGDSYAAAKTSRFLCAVLTSLGVKIDNESKAYVPKQGTIDCSVDLAPFRNWEFALDPDDKGLEEKVEFGERGSLDWLTGLIADGAEVRIGLPFENFIRKEYDGAVWYRLSLDVPEELLNSDTAYLYFDAIDDWDDTYVNGVKVGSTGEETPQYWLAKRNYAFPATLLHAGKNLIAIRVFDARGEGGIVKLPAQLSNRPMGGANRGWFSPYDKQASRDYDYPQDAIRHY